MLLSFCTLLYHAHLTGLRQVGSLEGFLAFRSVLNLVRRLSSRSLCLFTGTATESCQAKFQPFNCVKLTVGDESSCYSFSFVTALRQDIFYDGQQVRQFGTSEICMLNFNDVLLNRMCFGHNFGGPHQNKFLQTEKTNKFPYSSLKK